MRRTPAIVLSFVSALAITAGAAPRASAGDGAPPACVLPQYTIGAVAPHLEVVYVKVNARRVRGAEIFVQAERGLTAEWLQLQIDRYRGARHEPSRDCVLDVRDTTVSVESRGPGFMVTVRADDDDTSQEVLRRARALRHRS